MDGNYVYLKNLQNQVIKPVTDLSAINLTTGDGIGVQGNTIGVISGYVGSAAFAALTDPATAANPDSAYIEGGTMFQLIGGYAVTNEINTGAPISTNVPNEVAVANLVNTIETVTGNTIHSVGAGLVVTGTQMSADFATAEEILDATSASKVIGVPALSEALHGHADNPDLGSIAAYDSGYLVGHYDVAPWGVIETIPMDAETWEIKPGHAYKLLNILGPIELTATACPADGFGTEAHIEVYNMGNGYIHFDPTIVIGTEALVANAVNDCTVRFHGGIATLQVEDVISGIYDVTTAASSGAGSLDDAFNVGSRFVHIESGIVGNAVFETVVTSAKDAIVMDAQYVPIMIGSFKTRGTNTAISINESTKVVTVTAGTFTLADYTIPSGSTVAVSGGGLAVEKVTGNGETSVIDLGGSSVIVPSGVTASASGCTFSGGSASYLGGAFCVSSGGYLLASGCTFEGNQAQQGVIGGLVASADLYGCTFNGNNGGGGGGTIVCSGGSYRIESCVFSENNNRNAVTLRMSATATLKGNTFASTEAVFLNQAGTTLAIEGSNAFVNIISGSGSVIVSSGAILDLTGNSRPTPIAPGGGITFEAGGATVLTGETAGTVDETLSIGPVSVIDIKKDGTTSFLNLRQGTDVNTNVTITGSQDMSKSNASELSGINNMGTGIIQLAYPGDKTIENCVFAGTNTYGLFFLMNAKFTNCTFGNKVLTVLGGGSNSGEVTFSGTNILAKAWDFGMSTFVFEDGAVLDLSGATVSVPGVGSVVIPPNTDTANIIGNSITCLGTITLYYMSGGNRMSKTLTGTGTYIKADGTTDLTEV